MHSTIILATIVACVSCSPPAKEVGPAIVQVLDSTGRTLLSKHVQATVITLDVVELKSGAYFVTLQGEQWQAYGRFIKE